MTQGKAAPIEERFWEKVHKTETCWLWTASTRGSNGYGQIGLGGGRGQRMVGAHRVSWEIHNGPIPDGKFVLHTCDNPLCVNPDHLWLGTIRENNADRASKGRNGDLRGERAPRAVLSDAQVLAIKSDTRLQRVIADEYGIQQSAVSRIKAGKRWPHLKERAA